MPKCTIEIFQTPQMFGVVLTLQNKKSLITIVKDPIKDQIP